MDFLKVKNSLNIGSSVEEIFESGLRASHIAVICINRLDFDAELELSR
jgi:hypothetical protein